VAALTFNRPDELVLPESESGNSMTPSLSGKIIVVTGAFGTLGAATAVTLAGAGGRVALIDRAPHAPRELMSACGPDAVDYGGIDLTQSVDAAKTIDDIKRRFGRLDVLVNIAGAFRWQTIGDGDPATWDLLYAINVKTALNTSKAALPHLTKDGGRIINVGAAAALKAGAGMGPYAASKAGVHRLTESLAEELKQTGITVNAVLPSIIDTPVNRADMPEADFSRWVTPTALARVFLFLASDQSQAITGALLPVVGRV
jgi:NAD(P)-dependent dehydrogenase (short-subunit alcohol dehydrogenase family)